MYLFIAAHSPSLAKSRTLPLHKPRGSGTLNGVRRRRDNKSDTVRPPVPLKLPTCARRRGDRLVRLDVYQLDLPDASRNL